MSEYIERKALYKALTTAAVNDKFKSIGAWAKAICILHDLPAADVVSVVHGRWVYHDDDGVVTCSECGNAESSEGRYCSYCGARMDGDSDAAD